MRLRADERWINSLICCYHPQAQCTGEMSKRERKRKHEKTGEGWERAKQKERRDSERIREPVGGGMKGWRWRDKHANKKRRQITLVSVHAGEAFLFFSACLSLFPTVIPSLFRPWPPSIPLFSPHLPPASTASTQPPAPLRFLPASR